MSQDQTTAFRERIRGRWGVEKTLVGGPDRNRRTLCCGLDEFRVTFNQRMDLWHPDDDKALHELCRYLNDQRENDNA